MAVLSLPNRSLTSCGVQDANAGRRAEQNVHVRHFPHTKLALLCHCLPVPPQKKGGRTKGWQVYLGG